MAYWSSGSSLDIPGGSHYRSDEWVVYTSVSTITCLDPKTASLTPWAFHLSPTSKNGPNQIRVLKEKMDTSSGWPSPDH